MYVKVSKCIKRQRVKADLGEDFVEISLKSGFNFLNLKRIIPKGNCGFGAVVRPQIQGWGHESPSLFPGGCWDGGGKGGGFNPDRVTCMF